MAPPDDVDPDATRDAARDAARDPDRDADGGIDAPPKSVDEEMVEAARETWRSLTGTSGYLPILLLLLGVMLSGPMLGSTVWGTFVALVFTGGTLLMTVYRSTNRPRLRRATTALTTFAIAGASIAAYIHYDEPRDSDGRIVSYRWEIVFTSIFLVLLLVALPLVLVRAFGHRRVSLNTVCATVSGYILIGLIFTATYRIIGGFSDVGFFAQKQHATLADYSYFSFVTMTTVGFGDLTARSDPSRGLVMLEAVLGQIFMVTAVARVVSMLGSQRSLPPDLVQRGGAVGGPEGPASG